MANKAKIGLDYFPCEVSIFGDTKMRKLIKRQGGKAITVYVNLLCNIYKDGYYLRWDDELPFVISENTGYEEGYINEVLKCCFQVDLLSKSLYESDQVITSKGIQERYHYICKLLKRKHTISEFSLIPSEELPNNTEESNIDSEELLQRKGKERKRKEIKENERGVESSTSRPIFLEIIFKKFIPEFSKQFPEDHSKHVSYWRKFTEELKRWEDDEKWKFREQPTELKSVDQKVLEKIAKKQEEQSKSEEKVLRAEIEKFRAYYSSRDWRLKGGLAITEDNCTDVFTTWLNKRK